MTIQSPGRRLRLFILSLSLFCAGVAVAQTDSQIATPPDITVVDKKWELAVHYKKDLMPSAPPMVDERTGRPTPPGARNSSRQGTSTDMPPDTSIKPVNDKTYTASDYYLYVKVQNAGAKEIRSIAYDYVFSDPGTKTELKRDSIRGFVKIGKNKTKWIQTGPGPGPPQSVSVAGLQKDQRSPFDERVEIKCVVFGDGTSWRSPNASPETCDELVRATRGNVRQNHRRIDPSITRIP